MLMHGFSHQHLWIPAAIFPVVHRSRDPSVLECLNLARYLCYALALSIPPWERVPWRGQSSNFRRALPGERNGDRVTEPHQSSKTAQQLLLLLHLTSSSLFDSKLTNPNRQSSPIRLTCSPSLRYIIVLLTLVLPLNHLPNHTHPTSPHTSSPYLPTPTSPTMANTRRRILKELSDLSSDVSSGITAEFLDGTGADITRLIGRFRGPPDTPYEGGSFSVDITLPSNYPFQPPKMKFETRVWHPNVSSQTVCCPFPLGES